MARATSLCNASTSRRSRSYVSAHTWRSVAPSISCAVIRTRSPAFTTDPSTTKPTCSSLAISGSGLPTALYRITDLREITRSEEHTSELQSLAYLVCRLLLEKKKKNHKVINSTV